MKKLFSLLLVSMLFCSFITMAKAETITIINCDKVNIRNDKGQSLGRIGCYTPVTVGETKGDSTYITTSRAYLELFQDQYDYSEYIDFYSGDISGWVKTRCLTQVGESMDQVICKAEEYRWEFWVDGIYHEIKANGVVKNKSYQSHNAPTVNMVPIDVLLQSREYPYSMNRGDVPAIAASTSPKQRGVPMLTGKLLTAAQAEAETHGFRILVTQRVSSNMPLNTVIEQTPAAGELLATGEIIQVTISGSVTVPNLIGLTRAQALTLAYESGLNDIQIVEYATSDSAKADRVADQVPKKDERVMNDEKLTLAVYVMLVDAHSSTHPVDSFMEEQPNLSEVKDTDETSGLTQQNDVLQSDMTNTTLQQNLVCISSYTTTTLANYNRNKNIEIACDAVTGTVVESGKTFSFNETVGHRTVEKGYLPAGAIAQRQSIEEIGGGVCQVSSTMFNAAAMANMEIVASSPHDWPSAYIEPGRDANVGWQDYQSLSQSLDFKFKNTSDYPIIIVAYITGSNFHQACKCTVEIYGAALDDGITIGMETQLVRTTPLPSSAPPEYAQADAEHPSGTWETVRQGREGYVYETYRVFYQYGNIVHRELLRTSNYNAYPELIRYYSD